MGRLVRTNGLIHNRLVDRGVHFRPNPSPIQLILSSLVSHVQTSIIIDRGGCLLDNCVSSPGMERRRSFFSQGRANDERWQLLLTAR